MGGRAKADPARDKDGKPAVTEHSLIAALREHASHRPAETAFTFVDYERDWEGVSESLTWSELYRRASAIAGELRSCGATGDRAVILAPQGLDYVAAFLGSLQAGLIAVPLSAPLGGATDVRVATVLRDASPTVILTTSAVSGSIAEHIQLKPGESAPAIVELDSMRLDARQELDVEVNSPPGIALLQYTSGSTRTPAGVVVSHKNIQTNCIQMWATYFEEYGGVAPLDTTLVSWLPLFHDMGLALGIISPVLLGLHTVLTSPVAFLQRPARWMQLLASHSGGFSAAPNVAFELAASKTSDGDLDGLDLGGVRGIINGAERVQPGTLKRFTERFAAFNLDPKVVRPSYGLAEATLYVATREGGQAPVSVSFDSKRLTKGYAELCVNGDGISLVSYGVPQSPMVRVVAPKTRTECPPGVTGEIWVHGDNVAAGYWRKPEETERAFRASIVEPSAGTPHGPWLRTGDLGFFYDGELFITGRIKDLLVIYGRNHSPDDVEATIQEVTPGRCVAIAVPDDNGVEQLVVVVESKTRDEPDDAAAQKVAAIKRQIAAAISRSHALSVADLALVPPGSIPLTTSGKVMRQESLQRYVRGDFTRIDAAMTSPAQPDIDHSDSGVEGDYELAQRLRTLRRQEHDLLVSAVRAQVAAVLGRPRVSEIDPAGKFSDLGLDSVKSAELIDRLKTVTGLDLPPFQAFDYTTPDEMATYLGQAMRGSGAAVTPATAPRGNDEPVAVVGVACRFPAGVDSAAGLWDLVAGGADVIGSFPADRGWDLGGLFDPDPDAVGKTYTRAGGFVDDVAGFDAEFFGISPREAQSMDPQQRLLLEVCWEALEVARIVPATLVGSQTGVFVGTWAQLYGADSDSSEGYGLTGLSTSVASGRVAYVLGLQGPAITVDTACSSSLVATHMACQSLRNGESTLALAGGVTVMATPAVFTEFARQRGLAVDGRCKAFSANADGTGWGEGAAVLVLERLSDAQRNNHPVLAVIAGSAVNQDGATNGLTAPNGPAQQRVITQAVANAGITVDQVDVVEAHGTGTAVGDPIEATALIATYGAAHSAQQPLWLGSVKSNLGHTQAAAGMAGMIKMIGALNHGILPPTLHVDRPSPHIDWSAGTVRLLTEPMAWPVTDHPRTAAVSSFGISGTNAHVILKQAPVPPAGGSELLTTTEEFGVRMWPVSARTSKALGAQADRLHRHLVDHPDLDLADVAYSLGATRTHHPYRAVMTASVGSAEPREDLLAALDALRAGKPHPQLTQHRLTHDRGQIVFVLPGQGGQYPGMGKDLYTHHRVFADAVEDCDKALHPFTGWSVRDVLCQKPSAPGLDRVDVVQPVLFTIMVSLAKVLSHYGIVPDAVIGHSQGEIAAAYIAGVLSLPEAAKVVALRSQALSTLRGAGAMASVLLGAEQLHPRLQPWGDKLSIAAINGPSHTVISGDPAALEEFAAACDRNGIQFRPITVDYASHSGQIETVRERLLAGLADLTPAPGRIPLYSTVAQAFSSDPLDTATMDADYWYRNLREPVRFHDAVAERLAAGEHTFVELSPHPVLAPAIIDTLAQTPERTQSAVITTFHRDRPDQDTLATALAQLHAHGHSPSWPALYPNARTTELPTYPFQHRRYWLDPTPAEDVRIAGLDRPEHPLLGAMVNLADGDQVVLTGRLSSATHDWLRGHQVGDSVILPATGFIELALQAGEHTGCPVIDELVLHTPLRLYDDTPTDVQIVVHPATHTVRRAFSIHSRTGGSSGAWTLHASGALTSDQPAAPPIVPPRTVERLDQDGFYAPLAQIGYHWDGLFRSLRGISTDPTRPDVVYAEAALPAGTDVIGYSIHPALLDAALQPAASLLERAGRADSASLLLPFAFSGITLHATAATQLHVQLTRTGDDTFEFRATDPTGAPVITIDALTVQAVPDQNSRPAIRIGLSNSLFELTWPTGPDLPDQPAAKARSWVVCSDAPDQLPAGLSNGPIRNDLTTVSTSPGLVIWLLPRNQQTPSDRETDPLGRVHTLTRYVLAQLQDWLARPDNAKTQLLIITSHAVSISAHDTAPDLAHAAVWGLIHTAQKEHPDRIVLLDSDDTDATKDALPAIIATPPDGEPQLALRNGIVHIPRLVRTPAPPDHADQLTPEGTVLITGGTGTLGALVAEHLVARHGIKHLLLLSRRGPTAPDADQTRRRLTALGAEVTITACDTANAAQLAAVLDSIHPQHPLRAVIHAAGTLDNALVTAMTGDQLEAVLAAKADSAWHLHRLTAEHDLAAFVLFSSAAGIMGMPGQANYAAANTFLDALACLRHHTGYPATSVAWGYWQTLTAMTAHAGVTDLSRMSRSGLAPITNDHGLALFDAALTSRQPYLLASPVNTSTLSRRARENAVEPILSTLTTARPRAATASVSMLAADLAAQTPQQRLDTVTAMVSAGTAAVLGHPDSTALDPDIPFRDLGFDSISTLELRNSLNRSTGLTLPATVIFNYPTPAELARHLVELLDESVTSSVASVAPARSRCIPVDNRLAHVDQALFETQQAVHSSLVQATWIYDRAIDIKGLRQFHRNLGCGLLGRRIERSPLPFARDRWVMLPELPAIDFTAAPRPRADVNAWAVEQTHLPIDPERGPGWRLSVLTLEDGGTAVSLVASHALVDAVGFGQAISDAVEGRTLDLGYPPAGSRTLRQALVEDLQATVKDLPDLGRALHALNPFRTSHIRRAASSIKTAPSPATADNDQTVEVPALTACVDLAEWDTRAKSFGVSSNSLVAAVACRLAVRVERIRDDGTVTLRFPVSLRTDGDTRGNALTQIDVTVDPTQAATEPKEIHEKITQEILAAIDNPLEGLETLPLAALVPRWLNRRLIAAAAGGPSRPVIVSNVGELPPAVSRTDGTDADYVDIRNPDPDIKKSTLEHIGGYLLLGSGRGRGKIFIRVSAYLLGWQNTENELRETVSQTLAEFGLTAKFDY